MEARDFSWRGNVSTRSVALVVDTRAPRVALETGLTYVRRGGAELVVYSVDEETVRDGVLIGEDFFPGYPHPTQLGKRVAFYALAPGTPPGTTPSLVAADRAGNELSIAVRIEGIERSFPEETIELSDAFMAAKVAEITGKNADDVLAAYLQINREVRAENSAAVAELSQTSSRARLWTFPAAPKLARGSALRGAPQLPLQGSGGRSTDPSGVRPGLYLSRSRTGGQRRGGGVCGRPRDLRSNRRPGPRSRSLQPLRAPL